MDYLTLIEDALDRLETDWPRDDDDHLIPCGACNGAPVEKAIVGARPVHTYDRTPAAFDALLDRERQGRTERLWLGLLHVGTATTHQSGNIYVYAFNEASDVVHHERDILPALMAQWGYIEAGTA